MALLLCSIGIAHPVKELSVRAWLIAAATFDGAAATGAVPRDLDAAAVRASFDESRWVLLNGLRAVTTVLAVGCLGGSFVLLGQHRHDLRGDWLAEVEGYRAVMTWILTIAGAAMIAMALRDIFHTLWHPGGFGTLARLVFKVSWRVTRLGSRRWQLRQLAGPWGLIGTLAAWTVLLVGGFTLIYLARMPQDFYFGSSLKPGIASDFVFSMYLSFVAVTTLGLGDIQPATPLLRLLVPIEALLGFVLLTAGISWILQLYPALIRRRALARRLTSMAGNDAEHVIETGEASIAVQHLEGVRSELAGVEMDLLQYGESYYFQEIQADVSLAAALPYVEELIDAGKRASSADVRNAAAMLADGLEAFRAQLRRRFLGDVADGRATLVAFARDHRQPVSW